MFTLNDKDSTDMAVGKQIIPTTSVIYVVGAVVDIMASVTFPAGSMPAFSISIDKADEGLVEALLTTIEPQFPQGIEIYSVLDMGGNGHSKYQRMFDVRSITGGKVANKKVFYIVKKPHEQETT
jgi:hypothetical protein